MERGTNQVMQKGNIFQQTEIIRNYVKFQALPYKHSSDNAIRLTVYYRNGT